MESINIQLEAFEGPFDLLFHLIEKNESFLQKSGHEIAL